MDKKTESALQEHLARIEVNAAVELLYLALEKLQSISKNSLTKNEKELYFYTFNHLSVNKCGNDEHRKPKSET